MCFPRAVGSLAAIVANLSIAAWLVSEPPVEAKLLSIAFFLPGVGAVGLWVSKRGSGLARFSGWLLVLSGMVKTFGSIAFGILATGLGTQDNWLATLGTVITAIIATLLAISALIDLCAGIPPARRSLQGDMGIELINAP